MIFESRIVFDSSRRKTGMEFTIANKEIRGAHPNTARVDHGKWCRIKRWLLQAYSIGGGRIRVSVLGRD